MVLFGAYHTAERFPHDERSTGLYPGPGSYASKSTLHGAPVPRYGTKLVEDGCVRPDGSSVLFRERDSWVRGAEGPKGLMSLSSGNPFVSPALYSTASGERIVRESTPSAFFDTHEARYVSPSKRCLTPDHERAAKGAESPGPGIYYPFYEAWDFAPPEGWVDVNKARPILRRSFNAKTAWGDASAPRPPDPARAAEVPSQEEREWLSERRGCLRPSTSPRCIWVTGVNTSGGLQAWGDIATKTGPIHVGRGLDCAPSAQPSPRRGPASQRRGPIHSSEARATTPGFRDVRYLDRERMRRSVGTAKDTPGPGEYDVRPSMKCGTTFGWPRPPKCSRNTTVATVVALAHGKGTSSGDLRRARGVAGRGWPSPRPARSHRFSSPFMGADSPGPGYLLPSDFDIRPTNKKTFHPPPCKKIVKPSGGSVNEARKRGPGAGVGVSIESCRRNTDNVSRARREMHELATKRGGKDTGVTVLPVNTSMGRGFLLRIRADGMSFVRLPWGVLYTTEVLTRRSSSGVEHFVRTEGTVTRASGRDINKAANCGVPTAAAKIDANPEKSATEA